MARRAHTNNMDDFFETVYHSSYDSVKKILDRTSSPNIQNSQGNTLIHYAVINDEAEKIQTFVRLGCAVNFQNRAGEKPIYLAVKNRNLSVAKALVLAGCDLDTECTSQTNHGGYFKPLQLAVVLQDQDMVKFLASSGEGLRTQPLLQLAIKNQDMPMLVLLLELGAALDILDVQGHTALTRALVRSNTDFLKTLLKYKPDLEQCICMTSPNAVELTPLLYTLVSSRLGVLKILLDAGANLECNQATKSLLFKTRGFRCFSPICFVVSTLVPANDSFWPLQCLIEANCQLMWKCGEHSLEGSDPESLNYMHDSAFFMALKHQKYKAALLLLQSGFDLTKVSWPSKGMIKLMRNHIENSGYESDFKTYINNPLSLDALCRNIVRECLGVKISDKIHHLPLPSRLKDYITLKGIFGDQIFV